MDDQNAGPEQSAENLISRPPTEADLVALCRELNQRGAKYIVVGGLAIIAAGLPRVTTDVDLMVAADRENPGQRDRHWNRPIPSACLKSSTSRVAMRGAGGRASMARMATAPTARAPATVSGVNKCVLIIPWGDRPSRAAV